MLRDIPNLNLRELPNGAAANVRDRLRDIRAFIRARRQDRLSTGGAERDQAAGSKTDPLENLVRHAASVVDDTLSLAEDVSTTLLSRRSAGPRPLTAYFPAGDAASWRGERTFRHDMYAAAKRSSSAFGVSAEPLRESMFSAAHSTMRRQHGPLLASLRRGADSQLQLVARVIATIVLELRRASTAEWGARSGNDKAFIRRYVPGLLCSALATLDPELSREPELFDLSLLAVEAREDRIEAALAQETPEALAGVFEALLAHLP